MTKRIAFKIADAAMIFDALHEWRAHLENHASDYEPTRQQRLDARFRDAEAPKKLAAQKKKIAAIDRMRERIAKHFERILDAHDTAR
jgi:hypothetical protein